MPQLVKGYRLKFDVYVQLQEWAKRFAAIIDATDQPRFLGKNKWEEVEQFFLMQTKHLQKDFISS